MSDPFYYPELDPKTMQALKVIQRLAAEHPAYWLKAPYSGDVQLQLEGLFKGKAAALPPTPTGPTADLDTDDRENWEFLFEETKTLYRSLKGAQPSGDEPTAQMGYFRTATSLLEKLLGMSERAHNLKQVSDFYQLVLDVMDSLPASHRTDVMTRLQEAMKGN